MWSSCHQALQAGCCRSAHGGRLENDVVERHLGAFAEPLERLARVPGPLHVHLGGEVEGGDRADRLRQSLGDRLSYLGERGVGVRRTVGRPRHGARSGACRRRRAGGALEIAEDDATLRSRSRHRSDVDAALRGDPARQRGGLHPVSRLGLAARAGPPSRRAVREASRPAGPRWEPGGRARPRPPASVSWPLRPGRSSLRQPARPARR